VIALAAGAVTLALTTVFTIAGVGAAFVLIPVFVSLGVEVHAAMATALLLNAVALSVASVRNARKGFIDFETGLPILIVATALSPMGAWASQGLDRRVLLGLFAAFLLVAASLMLFHTPRARVKRPSRRVAALSGTAVGVAAGFLGGLLGVGGGNIIVPSLVATGMEPRRASATTSFAVVFASLAGFLGHASRGGVEPALVAVTGSASAAGALLGSWLMTEKLRGPAVKRLLGGVLLAVAAKVTFDAFR